MLPAGQAKEFCSGLLRGKVFLISLSREKLFLTAGEYKRLSVMWVQKNSMRTLWNNCLYSLVMNDNGRTELSRIPKCLPWLESEQNNFPLKNQISCHRGPLNLEAHSPETRKWAHSLKSDWGAQHSWSWRTKSIRDGVCLGYWLGPPNS